MKRPNPDGIRPLEKNMKSGIFFAIGRKYLLPQQ
jgi:hypothetical protein